MLSGVPVDATLCFQGRRCGFNPWLGNSASTGHADPLKEFFFFFFLVIKKQKNEVGTELKLKCPPEGALEPSLPHSYFDASLDGR